MRGFYSPLFVWNLQVDKSFPISCDIWHLKVQPHWMHDDSLVSSFLSQTGPVTSAARRGIRRFLQVDPTDCDPGWRAMHGRPVCGGKWHGTARMRAGCMSARHSRTRSMLSFSACINVACNHGMHDVTGDVDGHWQRTLRRDWSASAARDWAPSAWLPIPFFYTLPLQCDQPVCPSSSCVHRRTTVRISIMTYANSGPLSRNSRCRRPRAIRRRWRQRRTLFVTHWTDMSYNACCFVLARAGL